MENWLVWTIVACIGLLIGLIVHAMIRYAENGSVSATLLAGIVGAFAGSYILTNYVSLPELSTYAERFVWAAVGALVLSLVVEFMFVGSTRGRVVTT